MKDDKIDWSKYEEEVFEGMKMYYPNSKVSFDAKIRGRLSGRSRQIDVLIESEIDGENTKIIVDGKYYGRKIDIKAVESFIAMVDDIGGHQGILVTNKGYSKSAIKRAHNGTANIDLDILNFDELRQFQGFGGMAYAGNVGALISAPFGWILDAKRREESIAMLYQRGGGPTEAAKRKEFVYVNFWNKKDRINTLEKLTEFQESYTLENFPNAKITYSDITTSSCGYRKQLRTISIDSYPTDEYTGFVEFDDFIFYGVLFTTEENKSKNLRKLKYIMDTIKPMQVNQDSVHEGKITKLEEAINNSSDDTEKANHKIQQAKFLIELNKIEEADKKFIDSINLLDVCFGGVKGRIKIKLLQSKPLKEIDQLIDNLLNLDINNPTVFQTLIELFFDFEREHELVEILTTRKGNYETDKHAYANFLLHLSVIYINMEKNAKLALDYLQKSDNLFKEFLPLEHEVFIAINEGYALIKEIE